VSRETQNLEWKESWKDDHLRWVCGFANAQGGKLEIGRNNKGEVVGLKDARKLLEDLPNKIRDLLGIIVDYLREHPEATLAEVANAIGKSKRAVERAAAKLHDENRIRYVGPAKGGHWEVIDQGGKG